MGTHKAADRYNGVLYSIRRRDPSKYTFLCRLSFYRDHCMEFFRGEHYGDRSDPQNKKVPVRVQQYAKDRYIYIEPYEQHYRPMFQSRDVLRLFLCDR